MDKNQRDIRTEARARGVDMLLHFTPLGNLASILAHGLVSRLDLENDVADGQVTDDLRLDEHPQCISLSVQEINQAMFQAKRREHAHWAVLAVDVSVLWEHRCRFCWRNAASGEIRRHRGFIEGPWAFREMFADEETFRTRPQTVRQKFEIPDNVPTDGGAEVQVFGRIGIEKITAVGVGANWRKTQVESMMKKLDRDIPVEVVDWIR